MTQDVAPYYIAVGNPPKLSRKIVMKNRTTQNDTIVDWPEDKIIRNRQFFDTDLTKKPSLDIHSIIFD